VWEV
jgi:hypothetical protein